MDTLPHNRLRGKGNPHTAVLTGTGKMLFHAALGFTSSLLEVTIILQQGKSNHTGMQKVPEVAYIPYLP